MKVIHSDQPFLGVDFQELSIFLAGPTPREEKNLSWRLEALKLLEELEFQGTVLVPERRDWKVKFDYLDQVEWEDEGMARVSRIVFWVPRSMPAMPALTTNVEFGRWILKKGGGLIYGCPPEAESCKYLDWLYKKEQGKAPSKTLRSTLQRAVSTA